VVAVRSGDRAGAVEEWKRAVQLDPRTTTPSTNIGTTLAADGRPAMRGPISSSFLRAAPPAFYAKDLREVAALLRK
jgi:hypothetical protein